MTILAIGNFLLGAVLARFFKVWILIAAFFFAAVCVDFSLLAFAVLSICLQAGYVSVLFLGLIPGPWQRHKNPVNHGTRPRHPNVRRLQLFSTYSITKFTPKGGCQASASGQSEP